MSYETDFDDLYGSKYFSVTDLHGHEPRRKIGKVEVKELKEKDGTAKKKFVIYFEGEDKPLVVNKTNATKLAAACGKDRAAWFGVTVELYSEMTSLNKEGVRLRVLSTSAKPAAADMNDQIPF